MADAEHFAVSFGFQHPAKSAGLKVWQYYTTVCVREVVYELPMTIITHVCIFTEQPASMIKQFLAERTICFRYTPVHRSYTSLDDVDAIFHLKTEEPVCPNGRIIRHWCPDSWIYGYYGTAIRRFHSSVYRNLEPEIAIFISLDGTFRLGDLVNRRFLEKPYLSYT